MAAPLDPWRTLGLAPGSSAEEVRRAYRRLAKANHPDAAGEQALPRFLAIQAAYEHLAGGPVRRRPGARPGTRPGASPSAGGDDPREPWRADPDRARASGRADRRRPGARPAGRGPDANGGPSVGGRPASAPSGPGSTFGRAASGRRAASDDARSGAGDEASEKARPRRPGGRRRAPNRATPYSTSYDPADEEPFEPGWSGATWYGASSGTYWTINPKEYADPRKHGPEYQRRARRSANGWILEDGPAEGLGDAEPVRDPGDHVDPAETPAGRNAGPIPDAASMPRDPSSAHARSTEAAGQANPATSRPAGGTWTDARAGASARTRSAPTAGSGVPPTGRRTAPTSDASPDRRFTGPLLPVARTPLGRLFMALLAWPPLGLGVAVAIGEETGCGRFAASCGELSAPGTWVVQAAILVLLLAVPVVARWSAHGTIATLVVGVPSALVLSAGGGSRQPEASSATLAILLVVAYLLGVAYALLVPRLQGRRDRAIGR